MNISTISKFAVSVLIFFVPVLKLNAQNFIWDFNKKMLTDQTKSRNVVLPKDGIAWSTVGGSNVLVSNSSDNTIRLQFHPDNTPVVNVAFDFKGRSFSIMSFTKQLFRIAIVNGFVIIKFDYEVNGKRKSFLKQVHLRDMIPFNGIYLNDDNFHHYNVIIDGKNGRVSLLIDGERNDNFSFPVEKFNRIIFEEGGAIRMIGALSKLEVNTNAMSAERNRKLAVKSSRGSLYDEKDFAPGFPAYNVSTLDQLKSFPLPRYQSGFTYKRNFPWFDITYLSWLHKTRNNKGPVDEQSKNAVNLMSLLYDKWNYYYEIPVLRTSKSNADITYKNDNSVIGALVKYAKNNKSIQTAGILFQTQNNPTHIGLQSSKNFELSGTLPANYYLRDAKSKFILNKGKKVLSPLAPLDYKYNDAKNAVYYLQTVQSYLGRPIDFLNENGEIFGHKIPISLLKADPNVQKDISLKNMDDESLYNGYFQNKLDTAYKNYILRALNWNKTAFSFYNVSAYNDSYWPGYSMRRTSNNIENNNHYSTPSFYPASPGDWFSSVGARNGIDNIAEGRRKEILLGDKYFSPYIAAGWDVDDKNILSSQWLALNKSLLILGAEFFYVGYFNVTGRTGWANGIGPNDPKGYLYQLAVPAYAQALLPFFEPFISKGQFVQNTNTKNNVFRLDASKFYHFVYAKKYNNDLLIVASIQPNSNVKSIIPQEEITEVTIDGQVFRFKIRTQGSVYILNQKGSSYVIRQLDAWHENTHPYWWSKNIEIEAELLDERSELYKTENIKQSAGVIDFSGYRTSIVIKDQLSIPIYKNNIKTIRISGKGNAQFKINGKLYSLSTAQLRISSFDLNKAYSEGEKIQLEIVTGSMEIDNISY
ncbi:cysteine peptidase family C39 domain-containing protein [Gynurincola endophyticus]|uniref:hypothetical protein n=1 Tax=Gynurincola endophyticus TaxID=2479004 RepID=UPI000F8DE245|nr:hypothetical protein [Gynurincola endophyticus]